MSNVLVFHLQKSGLSSAIGEALTSFKNFQPLILVLLVCIITEVSSNTATATLFIPILAELVRSLVIFCLKWLIPVISANVFIVEKYLNLICQAKVLSMNPLYLILPATVSTSFAFMLPVATPPNAIVFAYGHLKIFDMVGKCIWY